MRQINQNRWSLSKEDEPSGFPTNSQEMQQAASRIARSLVNHPATLDEISSWVDHEQEAERWDGMS